jgi:hypothetical protein
MRVRITKTLDGSIDGIQLARLSKGQVYDVNTSLGCYLLSEGMAEPAPNETRTAILPAEKQMFRQEPKPVRKGVVLARSLAADRANRGKNRTGKTGE